MTQKFQKKKFESCQCCIRDEIYQLLFNVNKDKKSTFTAITSCPKNLTVDWIRCNTEYHVLNSKLG